MGGREHFILYSHHLLFTVLRNFLADGGRVTFNACDQVQMKLTQLELNSVRLVTNGDCIGEGV